MKRMVLILFLLVFFCSGILRFPLQANAQETDEQLEKILKKTAEYCERIKNIAFHYVCHERISERTNFFKRTKVMKKTEASSEILYVTDLEIKNFKDNQYVYDYQLIKKGDQIEDFEERRILLEENGKKKQVKNAELKLSRWISKNLIFGPVGFLSEYWQRHFDYQIIGWDEINDRDAIIISATPKESRKKNDNSGKIWVDAEDHSILKISWDPSSIKDFDESITSSIGELKRSIQWTVFYGTEKNNVRFPSKQIIKETISSHTGTEHPKYTVTILYDNYQFFTVGIKIK